MGRHRRDERDGKDGRDGRDGRKSGYEEAGERSLNEPARRLSGDNFESRSAALLRDYGYRVVTRQYRTRMGEIDIIACNEQQLLFVEVRARRHRSHGGAAASVDRRKQCKLSRCAAHFLSRHPQWRHLPCRFDVIAWETAPSGHVEAHWIPAAFIA